MSLKYKTLANVIEQKIYSGELKANQKLLSIRNFAAINSVSISTAISCYEHLEAKGVIYVRPKAGCYVSPTSNRNVNLKEREVSKFPLVISNLCLHNKIQMDLSKPGLVQLASLQLDPKLLPINNLRKSLQRAIKHAKVESYLYHSKQGNIQLRQALVNHWQEDGIFVDENDVFITTGCMQGINIILQQITRENDSVIIVSPTFYGQLEMLSKLKLKIIEVAACINGFDLIELETVMRESSAKVCILSSNFQNPLGYLLINEEKECIAKLADKYQCIIIEDDVYGDCSYTQNRPLPIKHWDKSGYVVWCGSFTKSLSASYRLGWFCIGKKLNEIRNKLIVNNVSVNELFQLGMADFIYSRSYRSYLDVLRSKLYSQTNCLVDILSSELSEGDIELVLPKGGYSLWLKLPENFDSVKLYYLALEKNISVMPGVIFSSNGRYRNYIRLNAGYEINESLVNSIGLLSNCIKSVSSNVVI